MMRCALITHPDCLLHEIPDHPERPARLVAILNRLVETGLESELSYQAATPVGIADFERIHDPGFVHGLYAEIWLVSRLPRCAANRFSLAR